MKNPDFLCKNPDFLLKNPDFIIKNSKSIQRHGHLQRRQALRRCDFRLIYSVLVIVLVIVLGLFHVQVQSVHEAGKDGGAKIVCVHLFKDNVADPLNRTCQMLSALYIHAGD